MEDCRRCVGSPPLPLIVFIMYAVLLAIVFQSETLNVTPELGQASGGPNNGRPPLLSSGFTLQLDIVYICTYKQHISLTSERKPQQ